MRRLAALLPDVPRFLETRGMLLEGCDLLGMEEGPAGPNFVARGLYPEGELVSVIGHPPAGAIVEAVSRNGDTGAVIAMPENASFVSQVLPGWEMKLAILHLLGQAGLQVPGGILEGEVRLLSGRQEPFVLPTALPPDLREELEDALQRRTPLAAAFAEEGPVSFCYVASETEGLWDVAIDTVEGYRRRGYAERCAVYLIHHMQDATGKAPVWGALETNAASMSLAAKLGFVPVDRFFVLEPGEKG